MTHSTMPIQLVTTESQLWSEAPVRDEVYPITLAEQLSECFEHLETHFQPLPEPHTSCMLFITVSASGKDATVFFVRRATLEAAWREGTTRVRQWAWVRKLQSVELRVDWPQDINPYDSPFAWAWSADSQSASAWAVADDDLEYAELMQPIQSFDGRQISHGVHMNHHLPLSQFAAAPMNLLLRLRGIHIGNNGVRTVLPRTVPTHHSRRNHSQPMNTQWLPYAATLRLLALQQLPQGNWWCLGRCDHLGMLYALLLAQRHMSQGDPAHAMLVRTIERAVEYLTDNIDKLLLQPQEELVEQAMCLLVVTRYITDRHSNEGLSSLIIPMDRLAQNLSTFQYCADAPTRLWVSMALHAFDKCQEHVNGESVLNTAPYGSATEVCSLKNLVDTFFDSLSAASNSVDNRYLSDASNERWQSIAIAEYTLLNSEPDIAHQNDYESIQSDLEELLKSIHQQIIWPEMRVFLPPSVRDHAAFFQLAPARGMVTSGRASAHLLVTAYAIGKLIESTNPDTPLN